MPAGRDNTISQMKELILQNYNHASIVTWGLSNEITISTKDKADMLDNHHVLNDLCHAYDKTRPTTLACYAMCNPFGKVVHISDLVSYNLYLGWYVPGKFLNDLFFMIFHARYPKRCLGYSEYGAEGMPNLHSEHPRRGDHTEEYQALYHEYMIRCFARFPWLWATHVWNMFDFAADARDQGGEPGMNHKGLVTFDRKTKKDSFYLYKCFWNPEPMVHICSKRFKERGQDTISVRVYTNATKVSLYCNGKLLEEKTGDHVFAFSVKLTAGENTIEAVAGECKDSAVFVRTDSPKSYKLQKSSSKSANWV
jgi:beta-galactosidase